MRAPGKRLSDEETKDTSTTGGLVTTPLALSSVFLGAIVTESRMIT
jgi:hypothetical protein